jgi:hypothetical protein
MVKNATSLQAADPCAVSIDQTIPTQPTQMETILPTRAACRGQDRPTLHIICCGRSNHGLVGTDPAGSNESDTAHHGQPVKIKTVQHSTSYAVGDTDGGLVGTAPR